MAECDGFIVMLSQAPADAQIRPNWRVVDKMRDAYFWVDDVDGSYDDLVEQGANIDYHLGLKPYGVRVFCVRDPNDHDIALGHIVR